MEYEIIKESLKELKQDNKDLSKEVHELRLDFVEYQKELNKVLEKTNSILERNTDSLEVHMRRTEALEELLNLQKLEISKLAQPLSVRKLLKNITMVGSAIAAISGAIAVIKVWLFK